MAVRHLVYNKSWIGSEIWSPLTCGGYESIIRVTKASGATDLPHILWMRRSTDTGMGRVKRRAEIALAGQRTGETNWSPFFLDGEINLDCTWSNNNWDRIWIPHSGTEDEEWHMLGCVFGCIINCISGSAESTCVRSLLLLFVSDVEEEGAVNIIRCPSTSCTYWLLTQYQMH